MSTRRVTKTDENNQLCRNCSRKKVIVNFNVGLSQEEKEDGLFRVIKEIDNIFYNLYK